MSDKEFYRLDTVPGGKGHPDKPTDTTIPDQIGPYKIESLLETGGMSRVYLATDKETNDAVTIKVLLPKYLSESEVVERFQQEAEIISKADHPNVIKLLGYGEWEKGFYIAMDFVQGVSLRRYLQTNPPSLKKALEIILEVAYALCHLHTHGIIHRDLKLENILVTDEGEIKVIDFGIAQILTDRREGESQGVQRVIGTPIYMSPEQRRDPESVSYPSDIYSLGIIAYELILGKLSHGKVHLSLMPKGIQKIFSKALQPQPEDRYQDVVDFISAISAYMNSELLAKEQKTTSHLTESMESLQQAQKNLVPQTTPSWEGIKVGVAVHKGEKGAGIYYDFLKKEEGEYAVVMALPSHPNYEGIVYLAALRGSVRSVLAEKLSHEESLKKIDELVREDPLCQRFIFSLLTVSQESYQYSSCGMGSLWHFNGDRVEEKEGSNTALGEEREKFVVENSPWKEGDLLLMTTQLEKPLQEEECLEWVNLEPEKGAEAALRRVQSVSKEWFEEHAVGVIGLKKI